MPIRFILAAAAVLVLATHPASARQLAIGAAAGYFEPPGFYAKPVYTLPNGGAWTPVDTSMGFPFREPIYSTPPGYKYIYVRGYYWKRMPNPYVLRLHRRVVRASAVKKTRRHAPCITDIGFGRYELCGRFYR